MRGLLIIIFAFIFGFCVAYFVLPFTPKNKEAPSLVSQFKEKPFNKYTIENLGKTQITPAKIEIDRLLSNNENFASSLFFLSFSPNLNPKETKKVSGIINIPNEGQSNPLVILFRGYIDQKTYKSGDGTKRVGEYLANNGFITLAPDFLGYGESDKEADNIFESRFQTYVTALTLVNSLKSIDKWDGKNVFIWGHSNGGQIALTILEITQLPYPTVLWAPVSKPFPYSVLYYTDESDDRGKLIRKELAKFEELYDPDLYAIDRYFDKVRAPLQLHQGINDDAVPAIWSDSLSQSLKDLDKDIAYLKYPGTDHNLNPSWSVAVQNSLTFFKKYLTK